MSMDIDPDELRSFSDQVRRSANSTFLAQAYAAGTCGNTTGLNGVLEVFRSPIGFVSETNASVLLSVKEGLRQTASDIGNVAWQSERDDAESAAAINSTFPDAPDIFPDLVGPVGSPHGYDDHWEARAEEPTESAEELTEESIDVGGVLGAVDWVWKEATGEGLLEKIVQPLVGDPGRLAWLSTAYQELGGATYAIAWNLRSGTMNVAPHWNGDSGQAFELYMFRWHMGLGGLGDAQHKISTALRSAYDYVIDAINTVFEKIESLVEKITEMLVKKASGPFGWITTVWEVVTGDLWEQLQELVDDVQEIVEKITTTRERLEDFKERIDTAMETMELLLETGRDPGEALERWVQDAYHETINFEGSADWTPTISSTGRAALLPI